MKLFHPIVFVSLPKCLDIFLIDWWSECQLGCFLGTPGLSVKEESHTQHNATNNHDLGKEKQEITD